MISSEEQKLIEQHRFKMVVAEAQLSSGYVIISIAAQWAEYSNATGYGLTYSQFCDGFGFDDRVKAEFHPYRKLIYEGVKRMYSVIDNISVEIGNSIATKTHSGM